MSALKNNRFHRVALAVANMRSVTKDNCLSFVAAEPKRSERSEAVKANARFTG